MTVLPPADWTGREDLAALVTALGEGTVRWVGGAVRDTMLGLPVADIDAATTLRPEEVVERCKAAGIRTVPTGIAHGTVTALLAQGTVEITTLRHDVSTDGRRATVAFASDWREDAARRDFTINALYADPVTLEVTDFFGGIEDLALRRVRFIGDARQRIAEDHLRILRYFRFQARFGDVVDEEAEVACRDMAATLKGLSRERVASELLAILALPDPSPTVLRMSELGVLQVVLPEADPTLLAALVAAEQRFGIPSLALRRMAALLPPDPLVADKVAARLKLSTAQRKRLTTAAGRSATLPGTDRGTSEAGGGSSPPKRPSFDSPLHHPADGPPPRSGEDLVARALAYRHGPESAIDVLLLTGRDPSPVIGWTVPQLPLKGGEIVQRGVGAGPDVARILRAVERRWIAEGFPDRARVEQMLAEELTAK
ncbi:CCA tRNA nucleotidyltransferase [Altererythrobacter sp. KTW20L]|uniref:CCA tRNA nucleotidyltransferase n=1 Tax=Altererythrobacter sp. KTW20L TaxID=2942210 RepID=UPI0020BF29DF|nr:CCA tRNA nucleotidyltransferase [Altererythrobacter sp. KTW20L]MCL6249558.1 CCA tRNA nucleotidyltransferase [Altererythrobacter sp. KTW20L]